LTKLKGELYIFSFVIFIVVKEPSHSKYEDCYRK